MSILLLLLLLYLILSQFLSFACLHLAQMSIGETKNYKKMKERKKYSMFILPRYVEVVLLCCRYNKLTHYIYYLYIYLFFFLHAYRIACLSVCSFGALIVILCTSTICDRIIKSGFFFLFCNDGKMRKKLTRNQQLHRQLHSLKLWLKIY